MHQYYYNGPVMEFGVCISSHWEGITYAISEKKARSNLIYQFKKQTNRTVDTKIELTGKIMLVDDTIAS